MKPQVDKSIYFGPGYITPNRFASYAYQVREILDLEPRNLLEIGIGNGLVSYMLRKAGVRVTTLDFDESLEPDIVASVTDIPLPDESFDVVACFEVLEHIPFDMLRRALEEVFRVARRCAVVSMPHRKRFYKIEFTLPKVGRRRIGFSVPFLRPPEHRFDGEHYWEIGKNGCPLRKVLALVESVGFRVQRHYRIWENPYHRMFILGKIKPWTDNKADG